jgi:hypothetical protein
MGRPIAAPLDRCAELLGVDLATVRELAAKVAPYICADGTRIWSLMQLDGSSGPRCTAGGEAATSTVDGFRPPPLGSTTEDPEDLVASRPRPAPCSAALG